MSGIHSDPMTLRQLLSLWQDSDDLFDWLFDHHISAISWKADKWTPEERFQLLLTLINGENTTIHEKTPM